MATPYDSAIAALEEEITALTAALQVLRRRSQDHQNPSATTMSTVDFGSVTANPTNEVAVDKILTDAFPKYLGITDIVERGPRVGGRVLNKNSVRWVIKHGVDDNRILKKKEGGRAWYKLKK